MKRDRLSNWGMPMSNTDDEILISADSHVIEDPRLWVERLPASMRVNAPIFPERKTGGQFQAHEGGWDPATRLTEMSIDGVSQEVLYPSLAMSLFGLDDAAHQQACFSIYNDWLIEYCSVARDRLFGIAMISTYDIPAAVTELTRCQGAGLVGAMVWEVPPPELSFATDHYDDLWRVAEAIGMPVSLHILTGQPYNASRTLPSPISLSYSAWHANNLVFEASNAISDLITSGVFERFPRLRFVLVESEASWIPFILSRWDIYASRSNIASELTMAPSEYFRRNFSATFFNDPTLAGVLDIWGVESCMWSNDFPHANSTWPNSRKVIERDLGHLRTEDRRRILSGNVTDLYRLPAIASQP
jgi:predicted TIM-barrel fold metal-dependent hydrolase